MKIPDRFLRGPGEPLLRRSRSVDPRDRVNGGALIRSSSDAAATVTKRAGECSDPRAGVNPSRDGSA
jgi:hypothetical protein